MRSRKNRSKSGKRGDAVALVAWAPSPEAVPGALRGLTRSVRLFRKVIAHNGIIATNASGFVAPQALTGSNAVTSAATWSADAALALEYRVVAIGLWVFPIINCQTNLTLPPPSHLAISAYSSGVTPGTYDQVAQAPGAKFVDGHKPFKFFASAKGFPDALLFTATSGSIATANTFGIQVSDPGSAPAGPVSSTLYRWAVQYLVEFRSLD
jgi:hypothetical protein